MTADQLEGSRGEGIRSPEKEFSNQVIVVTGANRLNGIGFATAKEFARLGARAIVLPHRPESTSTAETAAEELRQLGPDVMTVSGDLADAQAPKAILDASKAQFGSVDVLINNAGMVLDKPINSVTADDWETIMHTNLRSATLFLAEAPRYFDRKKGGAIVNVSSVVGIYGNTGQALYAQSKAGLDGLMRSAYQDLARRGIRINNVAPGFINTHIVEGVGEMQIKAMEDATPLGRLGEPEDVASVIAFLASSKAAFMTGQTLEVDGGLGGGIIAVNGLIRAGWQPKPPKV